LSISPDKPGVEDRANVPVPGQGVKRPRGQERRPLEIVPTPEKQRKLNQVPPVTKTQEGEVAQQMRPPRVVVPLKDSDLEELMPVILRATIDAGVPMASVSFFYYKDRIDL
jgi:hypothetical protein